MRSKWCKYVLSSAMAFCGIYANGMLHSAFAQETVQPNEVSGNEVEDLKWQLQLMEESASRQQEQIQAINNRLNAMKASVEDVKKIGSTVKEPNDFRVYWKEGLNFDSINKNFKLKIGGRIQQDWGWFTEDKEIRDTIGDQVDGAEFRRARIYLSGTIYNNIDFKMEYDFAGGGRPSFTDVFVELKEIPVVGNFKVGHFKEPFSLEELTSSNYITFMERSLPNVFAPARNTGMMLHNTLADKRMTWATGVFRNADDFGDSEGNESTEGGYSFSGRLTGLPWYEEEGRKLLHTGIGYSYQNAFQNEIRYRQRPEMGMADRFVDTGTIKDAEAAHLFGPELALVYGPFSLQTEYIFADEAISGGRLQDTTVGVNWHLNPNMRIMLNYVHSEADVSGEDGSADLVGMRFNIFF